MIMLFTYIVIGQLKITDELALAEHLHLPGLLLALIAALIEASGSYCIHENNSAEQPFTFIFLSDIT
jgi:hypothetical protein